ncbi:hypothetical protein DYB37_004812 [Aphanomyces astaci]|nr:hypothetical protein DYB36_002342 [Aphanomyces astaci]RHY15926.1 hypothetical protein DYB25_005724 [Aphanomyces astaci]RHY68318.1 hypothetical protein DYB30_011740 [Aphanomyces astaci]RHY74428.1 hypothetical protein DYB34_011129 [Aphanomyces astaci]RHZ18491.1 hypothetical protein DYB37_004812 [Aphanomyces astaci]
MSQRKVAAELCVPQSCVRNWDRVANKLHNYKGNKKTSNLPGAGRPTILPEPTALLSFMQDRRAKERALTCTHMINYLKKNHQCWLMEYIARQKPGSGYGNLLSLLEDFCGRHGYTHQLACKSKKILSDLESTRDVFAVLFHDKYGEYSDDCVYNVDETGLQYDMPPRYIWSLKGSGAKLSKGEKHSYRMTAVLTIRRDGLKLPILFVIKGKPGAIIESKEFSSYPQDHVYMMQNKAWMDSDVWEQYLWRVLAERVERPSLLVLDNLECHVSEASTSLAEQVGYTVCSVPPNATSHCQPLDVSIMAPFKRHLRDLWICEDVIEDDTNDEDWYSPTAKVKRITMINRAIKAWEMITPDQVRGSFLKAIPIQ